MSFVVPIKTMRDAREEAAACNTLHEINSMGIAVATELEMLQRYQNAAAVCGNLGERWLARRLSKRRTPLLLYFRDLLSQRAASIIAKDDRLEYPPWQNQ